MRTEKPTNAPTGSPTYGDTISPTNSPTASPCLGVVCPVGEVCVDGVCVGEGTLRFTLTWDVNGDLDLNVVPPPPCAEIYFNNRESCGGKLDVDDTTTTGPENIFWLSAYPPGDYIVCAESYTSFVANANFIIKVVVNGALTNTFTGNRGGVTDRSVPCTSEIGFVVTIS